MSFLWKSFGTVHCPVTEYSKSTKEYFKIYARGVNTHTQITHESAATTSVKLKAFNMNYIYRRQEDQPLAYATTVSLSSGTIPFFLHEMTHTNKRIQMEFSDE